MIETDENQHQDAEQTASTGSVACSFKFRPSCLFGAISAQGSEGFNKFDLENCSQVKTQSSSVSLLQQVNPGSDLPTVNLVEQGHGSEIGLTEEFPLAGRNVRSGKVGARSGGGGFCRRAPEREEESEGK